MNLPINIRSDSGVTVEQQQFNIELFIPSLGRSGRDQQRHENGAIAVRLRSDIRSDSRSDSSGATEVERQWRNSGAIAMRLRSDSRSDSSGATVER